MKLRYPLIALWLACTASLGCQDDSTDPQPAALDPQADSGTQADADPATDAAHEDAAVSQDGATDAGSDATAELDAETEQDAADAQVEPDAADDAPVEEPDAADDAPIEEPDAGPDATVDEDAAADVQQPDAEPDVDVPDVVDGGTSGENVIANSGFEDWTDGTPDHWLGEATNISTVLDQTNSVHGGGHACKLSNSLSSHKRFSTAPFALADGHYDCTYWVRGRGEIRNAFYDGDYSTYSGYTTVDDTAWKQVSYSFNLDGDAPAFELVFSVRNTDPAGGDLVIDDVYCARRAEPCDQVQCPEWAKCNPLTVTCEAVWGRCADATDCYGWEQCDANHTCVLAPGRCNSTADCELASSTPKCDTASHTCVAGDPCEGVTCDEWRECDPNTSRCVLKDGRCESTADCVYDLPACNGATRTCVSADHPSNVVPNGGFESWSVYYIPYLGEHLIPDGWYGLDIPGSSEIDPERVLEYSTSAHSGALACQIIQDGIAERFTSESFPVPVGNYTCAYWVRGKGTIRHRTYSSAGWSPYTDHLEIDTLEWTRVPFEIRSNVQDMRIIFYASYTDASKDHVQIDDVVCTRDPQ